MRYGANALQRKNHGAQDRVARFGAAASSARAERVRRRMVRPFDIVAQSAVGYWLVTAEDKREPKKVRLFRDWLRNEVPDSLDGYAEQQRRAREGAG